MIHIHVKKVRTMYGVQYSKEKKTRKSLFILLKKDNHKNFYLF